MLRFSVVFWAVFWLMLLLNAGQAAPANAADNTESQGIAEYRQKMDAMLLQMSAEEIEDLDRQLAQALQLYYEEAFDQALPIFQEIAEKAETLDVMFWVGTSAAKMGRFKLAEEKYRQMLVIEPELNRIRLELADVYIGMGRHADALLELKRVLATKPPETVRRNIEKRMAMLAKRGKKTALNLLVSIGYQYDDNVSSGPDQQEIVVSSGTLNLTDQQTKLASHNIINKLRASIRHD